MISIEELMTIKVLHPQGYSQRPIARQLGISRNTVKKHLQASEQTPHYKTRESKPSKLDSYKNFLQQRLSAAAPIHLSAVVLMREIQPQGYTDNLRYETLGQCHRQAFDYFQGVPQQIWYDNMKTVVIERDAPGDGKHRLHASLYPFAKNMGFLPKLCQPYRPQTKGKVERMVRSSNQKQPNPLKQKLIDMRQTTAYQSINHEGLFNHTIRLQIRSIKHYESDSYQNPG